MLLLNLISIMYNIQYVKCKYIGRHDTFVLIFIKDKV